MSDMTAEHEAALPPWREITTDDYHPRTFPDTFSGRAWITSSETIRALLQRQYDGEFRLRLVLREAVDLKRGGVRNPEWVWDYNFGPSMIFDARETVILLKSGRRCFVATSGAPETQKSPGAEAPGRPVDEGG